MRAEHWWYTVPLRLRSLFRRARVERELDEELQFHLALQAQAGTFGAWRDLERSKEECRDMRHLNMWDDLVKDVAYAARTLRKSPLFAITAAFTIALGIGASTAIFSVTDAVLLRPLPYRDPARLTIVFRSNPAGSQSSHNFLYSNADFFDLRDGARPLFEDIGGVASFRAFVPREDGSMEQIGKALVTSNFFRLMGARIVLGRDFADEDAVPQPENADVLIPPGSAAILSYEYWQRRYGGSTEVLGRQMPGGSGVTAGPKIVGVLERGFRLYFPSGGVIGNAPDFWVANNVGYDNDHRNLMLVGAIGRLRSGVSLRQAQERIESLTTELRKNSIDRAAVIRLQPMALYLVEDVRPAILALMGAVIFLLLIACANVANLLLVRASLRERELALRAALGARHWRIVRQLLVEAMLLAGLGTVLGVGIAWAGVRELASMAPANLPRIESTAIDWPVLLFAAAAGVASAAVFGLMPAVRAARPDLMHVLRGSGHGSGVGLGGLLRSGVVIVEAALSFVLLIGSGLMFRSFLALERIDPGYDTHGLLTFYVTRDWPLQRQDGRRELLREMQSRLAEIPGVESVAEGLSVPLASGARPRSTSAPRRPPGPPSVEGAEFQQVSPGYFETLRTPVLEGRIFTGQDDQPGRNLIVIDQLLAARAFPNESAVGKRMRIPFPNAQWAEVIGVVKHQRLGSVADPGRETVYFSEGFAGIGVSRYWVMRTAGDPARYAGAVRDELRKLDRQLVLSKVQTMETLIDRDREPTRFSLLLIGLFGAIAVVLAGVGLYGVLASMVRQRTAEIGVRMALGAAPVGIVQLVVSQGLRLSGAGILLGVLAALAVTRVMASMLVGVKPADPLTFAGMALLFLLISALASWLPARRAAGLDPSAALREE
ncbi:MAG TPA: ABC transporter permease [Bryobacteraceae bacterium]|nr:ABC transporter permease [Bryobacteraceae bacterium]